MESTFRTALTNSELLRQALKLAPVGILATLVNASVLVAVLWPSVSHLSLSIWFAVTIGLALERSVFLLKHRPASLRPGRTEEVTRWFVAGLGLSGIAWGSIALFLFPVSSPTHQMMVVFVLCGMVAGAVEIFSSILPAFTAFVLPALIPLFVRFLTIGGAIYFAMAGMTILYIVLTFVIAIRINIANRRLIELKEHFVQVADERATINARLQDEIADRHRVEDSLRDSEEQLRLLSSRILSAQEEERKRIARELHDSIGASLCAAKFSMENVVSQMEKAGKPKPEQVNYSIRVIQSAVEEVRRIVMDIRPSTLDDHGIIATLNWYCQHFQTIHPNLSIDRKIEIEEDEIPENLKIIILRIVQEAFHNILKYSGANRVKVSIKKTRNTIRLSVDDNGIGFDSKSIYMNRKYRKGFGLVSMRERTELSGGSFTVQSEVGKGTKIQATWVLECQDL